MKTDTCVCLCAIRQCLEKYTHIYVLKMENMRSNGLKDLRIQFKEDRFVFGKQNVMSLALGRTPEEEPAENLSLVSAQLSGTSALLFTNRPQVCSLAYPRIHFEAVTSCYVGKKVEKHARRLYSGTGQRGC